MDNRDRASSVLVPKVPRQLPLSKVTCLIDYCPVVQATQRDILRRFRSDARICSLSGSASTMVCLGFLLVISSRLVVIREMGDKDCTMSACVSRPREYMEGLGFKVASQGGQPSRILVLRDQTHSASVELWISLCGACCGVST